MVLTFHKNTNNNQHTNHFNLGVLLICFLAQKGK